jgi:hypothetical protein
MLGGPHEGETIKFIYQIECDTLRIGQIADSLHCRPHGFHDEGISVETYKRVK